MIFKDGGDIPPVTGNECYFFAGSVTLQGNRTKNFVISQQRHLCYIFQINKTRRRN
jgi:hypothetical protein